MAKFNLFALIVIVLLVVTSCSYNLDLSQNVISNYEEKNFDNIKTEHFEARTDLLNFIKNNRESTSNSYLNSFRREDVMMNKVAEPTTLGSDAMVKSDIDYSKTNNQVQGIDEADIIKTDGEYIYTISGKTLFIVKAYPGNKSKVISKVKLNEYANSIFVNGNTLAIFGNINNRSIFSKLKIKGSMSFMNIYDIKDKTNPKLVKEYQLEGRYFDARLKDNYVYLVTNSYPEYRVDHPEPLVVIDGVKGSIPISNIHYFDIPYNSPMFVNIHSVNLADLLEDIHSESLIVESNQNMYVSNNNMYLSYTEYVNEYKIQRNVLMDLVKPMLTPYEIDLIDKIKDTDGDVLSQYEKEQKIYSVYEDFVYYLDSDTQDELQEKVDLKVKKILEEKKYFEFTIINKIQLDMGEITPVANGKVPGKIINQFSLDEKDNKLRVATTINPRWSRFIETNKESTSNVYILDNNLKEVGSLSGLAKNERIYSTRFIDDRLYLVTFKQVDPFFVIDLSTDEPKVLGKLKIPGFSRYLHPYDKNIIIGIGQDTSDTGRIKGLKISLFDVTNVTNPVEVAKYVTESKYASSTALYEHKAFLFSKENNLLVIPAYSYDYNGDKGYNGAFVFNISKDNISLRGLIDHSSGSNKWSASVERSLYIKDMLYTKSLDLLRVNALSDLSSVANVSLVSSKKGDIKVY